MDKVEYWDIYDKNKQRTGRQMKRNDWCLKDDEYHLTVLGVVAHKDGRFLITKRVMTKAWAPGWWEVSGGAAQAGETSEEAVIREVKEETGLTLDVYEGGEELYRRPFYMGPGFTDEMSSAVFGTVTGTPNLDSKESTEDIQVILADRGEVRRILSEEQVSLRGAYLMTHFLAEGDPLEFLRK